MIDLPMFPTSVVGSLPRPDAVRALLGQADAGERLDALDDPFRLFRCHTIGNCVEACPKGLNPTAAINAIRRLLLNRHL